jgi:tetratricopeptide (TPR) repeat protein
MVRGQVVDEQGQPLAGVKIELQFKGKEPKTFVRTTNEKGSFVQVGLPSGPYHVQYSKDGYVPALHETTITAGGLTEIPTATLKTAPKAAAPPAGAGVETGGEDLAKEIQDTYAKAIEATRTGRLDESAALFKQVLETAPDLAAARYNLGYVYSRQKNWPAAEAEFKRVIELEPQRSDTYAALAAVYAATGRTAEAVELLSSAAPRFETDAGFQFTAGVAYLNAGESARAEAALKKAVELDASKVEAHYYLGTLAVGNGKVEEAVGHLETYLSAAPENAPNRGTATGLLEALKKPAKQ